MSSAGHVLDMLKRWKYNREQQKNLRHKMEDTFGHDKTMTMLHGKFNDQKFSPLTEKQQTAKRKQIAEVMRREEINRIIGTFLVLAAIALTIWILVFVV